MATTNKQGCHCPIPIVAAPYKGVLNREPSQVRGCYHCGHATMAPWHISQCERCAATGHGYVLLGLSELEGRLAYFDETSGHTSACAVGRLLRGRLVTAIEAVKRETARRVEHEQAVQSIARDARGVGQTI